MEPVRIRDDVDPNSPKYRRELIIVIAIVVGLSLFGGTCLGYKIRTAENEAAARQEEGEQPALEEPPARQGDSQKTR